MTYSDAQLLKARLLIEAADLLNESDYDQDEYDSDYLDDDDYFDDDDYLDEASDGSVRRCSMCDNYVSSSKIKDGMCPNCYKGYLRDKYGSSAYDIAARTHGNVSLNRMNPNSLATDMYGKRIK